MFYPSDQCVCFICGEEVSGDSIHWDGWIANEYGAIHFHQQCANFMATGLKRDVLESALDYETAEAWYQRFRV